MKINLSPIQQGMHKSKLKIAGTALAAAMSFMPLTVNAQEKQDTVDIATENTATRDPSKKLNGWEILGLIGGTTLFAWGFAEFLTMIGKDNGKSYTRFVDKEISKIQRYENNYQK